MNGEYRGQRVDNGKWVYGYYYKSPRGTYILKGLYEPKDILTPAEVHPSSIGQRVGRKDKNGVEAYSKDIVKFPDHSYLAEIEYYPEFAGFLFNSRDPETFQNPDALMYWEDDFEIISNTTDNSDLLDTN